MNLKNQPPIFVPEQFQAEIERFSKAFLMDMVWDFARRGMVDDDANTMGRIRETAEVVKIYRDREARPWKQRIGKTP
jgi:hypothetical protein